MEPGKVYILVATLLLLAVGIVVSPSSAQGDSGEAPSLYFCPDGRPIREEWLCDGTNDCMDVNATDELNCALGCRVDEFACGAGGQCIPAHWECDGGIDCSDGSDESNCSPQECHMSEFQCRKSKLCIPSSFVCDGAQDCGANDRSDERNCNITAGCGEHQFTCASGMCISASWECDGEMDCDDDSDEISECGDISFECGFGLFNCTLSGRCIHINQVCDGSSDCGAGSDEDEQDCPSRTCDDDEFKCADNRCILQEWTCDGDNDCGDWTDELDCDGACLRNQYTCITGGCVEQSLRCDGNEDCMDGSDEFLCPTLPPPVSCNAKQFPCLDGQQCIQADFFCDRTPQCDDGSDEDPVMCAFPSPSGTNECLNDNGGCQHICRNTSNNYFCLCRQGYQVDPDNRKACLDINECAIPGTCSQLCHNMNGSHDCSCVEGYVERFQEPGRCKAVGDMPPFLLFADRVDIRRVNPDGSNQQLLIKHLHNSIAIDFHYDMGYMYWTDLTQDTIRRARWDGTETTTVISSGLQGPGGLAVDWVTNKLYWTDAEKSRIEVSNLDGGNRATLFVNELGRPRAIVLDPSTRLMFWADWGTRPKIERASMDGRGRIVLQDKHLIWPNALTIDYPTQTLYWGDAKLRVIESCGIDGSNRRPVAMENIRHPFAITVFEDSLYWTDWEQRSVLSAEKSQGQNRAEVYGSLIHPMDIHMVHRARQPLVPNPCGTDNGGCSYLCLLSSENSQGYSCACPTGVRLADNGRDCLPLDMFLLFTRRIDVRRISLEVEPFVDVVLPIANTTGATGLEWDSQTNQIYWTDIIDNTINVANTDGTGQRVLIDNNILTPGGISLDWIGRKIYWTDTETDRIEVSNLDGSYRSILIYEDLDKPRAIAVFPSAGLMFWSDWGSLPKIETAALDGSQRFTIATEDLRYPNGLAIDYDRRLLFWVDAEYDVIEFANFDGSNRQILLETGDPSHPFGLTLHGDFIYWTDWNRKSIQRANKTSGLQRETIVSRLDSPMDVQVFHRNREDLASHPCLVNNGGCSHLCLTRPHPRRPRQLEASCACPMGRVLLDDGRTCNPDINAYLIFPTISDIRTISLDVNYIADIVLPIAQVSETSSVDVDLNRNELFWTNGLDSTIYHSPLSGGSPVALVNTSMIAPASISIDWIGGNIYWADGGTKRIEVSKLDGSSRRVLFSKNLISPSAIVVDLQSHSMFWTDTGDAEHDQPAKIERAAMDGSGRKEIVNTNLGLPRAITVDNPEGLGGRIYWTDSFLKLIESTTLEGKDRQNLLAGLPSPYGLAVFGDHLYWTDFGMRTVNRINKNDLSQQQVIAEGFDGLGEIRVIKKTDLVNKASFDHPCDSDRGCSHLCLPNHSIRKYSCSCPTGIIPAGTQCSKFPNVYLLFAARTTIRRISMDTENYDDVIVISDLRNAVALDYLLTGPEEGTIFWADEKASSIFAADLDGTNMRTIVTPVQIPDGLAVDWISKNIYWSDDEAHSIEVARVDGSNRRVIANTNLENPRGIAVHPHLGLMFWSDWGQHNIERANMDGSRRQIFVSENIYWPNGITIDYQEHQVYWVDAQTDTLESININGNERRVIVSNEHHTIYHPFSVAVYSGFVFWSDWQNRSIYRAHVREVGGTNQQRIIGIDIPPMQIQIVSSSTPRPGELGLTAGINPGPCMFSNGGCEHLCLPINTTHRKCACPDDVQSTNTVCVDRVGTPPAITGPKFNVTVAPTTDKPPVGLPDEPPSDTPPGGTPTRPSRPNPPVVNPPNPDRESSGLASSEAGGGSTVNKGVLIPLVVISIGVLAVLVGIITVAICFLKRQRDAQEQEQSLQRLAFTNPAGPTTLNRLKSPSPAPQKVTLNNAIPQPSNKNKQQQQQQQQQQKQPKVITNISKPNIFVEEPEVFELPPTSRRRRIPTPPDSPLLKPSSVPPSTETESNETPPPRPPKAPKPGVESSREIKINLEGEEESEVAVSGTHRSTQPPKPSVESTREVKINLADEKDTDSGTHSLELREGTPDLEEQETASAASSHSENSHEDEEDTSC